MTSLMIAEGGVKAEAVALVVAAVDLARVRRPVQADEEEEEEEEEEAVEMKMKEEKSVVELKTLPAEPPPVIMAAVASDQLRVQVSQIQGSAESSSPVPHFTVSKVSVPKHELSLEVSIAGSAIAALQKELSSSSHRKIIKPVKSPSPSRRAVAVEKPLPPPFRQVRYQSESRVVSAMSEEFEDWEPQQGFYLS
ncbi:uncharacterized protein PEZ65_007120 [Lycodopsis pacificus]